ncbi:acyltransferase [Paraburkholderia sp.]|uniref:acyltransferase n=1 Tax=Paraburkholderia sp. TaxID=1926495 RepID=UPI0039E261CD
MNVTMNVAEIRNASLSSVSFSMNIFRLQLSNGSVVDNPNIDGLVVDFRAKGSEVLVHEGALFRNCKFIVGAGSKISIGETHKRGLINTTVDMSGIGTNKTLVIKSGVSIESARFAMANESDLHIEIGSDCMLSSNIIFRATDGHAMFDLETRELLNRSRPIIIGDNCWIGSEALFMKGAIIANNSIVGTRALVASRFDEKNVVIAGVPGKIVKRNCGWSRTYIDNYQIES